MWKAVHAAANFDVYVVIVDEPMDIVFGHGALGNVANVNSHVFRMVHGGSEVEIFDLHSAVLGGGHGDNVVQVQFYGFEVFCGCVMTLPS